MCCRCKFGAFLVGCFEAGAPKGADADRRRRGLRSLKSVTQARSVTRRVTNFGRHVALFACTPLSSLYQHTMTDENPRPSKRQRRQKTETVSPEVRSTQNLPDENVKGGPLRPLPPAVLLASLPGLLAVPPNHHLYPASLILSLRALRKCLLLPALSPEIECRAWTGLAEIGMRVIGGGLSQHAEHPWAHGIENEVRIHDTSNIMIISDMRAGRKST